MRLYSFVAAAALLTASLAAHADVLYTYVGGGGYVGTTFTIDSPDFLTYSSTRVPVSTSSDLFVFGSSQGKLTSVEFLQSSLLSFSAAALSGLFYGSYTINQDGLYTSMAGTNSGGATLTISGSPAVTSVAATPEPSSFALLGTGLLGALGLARKRFA